MGFAIVEDESLDVRVAEGDGCPAEEQGHETPGQEMGSYEESAGCDEEEEEDG